MKFFYCRVSSANQNLDRQTDKAKELGIEDRNIFCDKMSGAKADRPALEDLLSRLREGDSVYVCSLDRLARSTKQLLELSAKFEEEGVNLISLKEGIDTSTSTGKFAFTVFAAVAEFQRATIKENQREGYEAARKRGKKMGRPAKSEDAKQRAVELYNQGGMTAKEIAACVGLSRATVYRAIAASKE